jgi:hypothetical protein
MPNPSLPAARTIGEHLRTNWSFFPAIIAIAYLFFITFPVNRRSPGYGLDISWQYALNALSTSPFIFGGDTNFTYGPLGYLLLPMNVGSNLLQGFWFAVVFQGFLAVLLLNTFRREKNLANTLLLVAALAISFSLIGWPEFESRFYPVFWLALATAYFSTRTRLFWLAALGILSGFALFEKFSLGASSVLGIVLLHIVFLIERTKEKRTYLPAPAAFLAVIAWQILAHFKSLPAFGKWLRASLELSSGYNSAMSLTGPSHQVAWGLFCLGGYAAFVALLYWRRSSLRHLALIAFPQIFVLFKSGFVRQDGGHLVIFFCSLPALPAILAAFGKMNVERVACGCLFVLFFCFEVATVSSALQAFDSRQITERLTGTHAGSNVSNALNALRHPAPFTPFDGSPSARLPEDWLELPRRENATVGILPFEISLAQSNRLNWKPNAVLQQYCAYTPALDRLGAEFFATTGTAPDFLIVDFGDIDGRYPLWSGPQTWQAVLTHYEVVKKTAERALLRRRASAATAQWRDIGTDTVRAGQWIEVPHSTNALRAAIDFQPRYLGVAANIFFRIPPTIVEVEYLNGRHAEFRLLPQCAGDGILMSTLPVGSDLVSIFEGDFSRDRVRRFRLVGPGIRYYRVSPLVWKELIPPAPTLPTPQNSGTTVQ